MPKIIRTDSIRNLIARNVVMGPEDSVTIDRAGGVELTIVALHPYDPECDADLTHGALDSQKRLRRVDRDATDALLERVNTALKAAGYDSFGGFCTGWGAWMIRSDYKNPNPYNLSGFADPIHY